MATEYSRELAADLHAAWMALHAIRSELPFGILGHERWKKLTTAMRVIDDIKDENLALLEQKVHALAAAIKEGK